MADNDKGWQLPTVVNPEDYWCYTIKVPQDIAYLRALRGAIGELAYYWNWQKDTEDTARQVVQNWLAQILLADMEFNESEGVCVDICDAILNCINTNVDIQQAIANYSSTTNISSNTPENAVNLASQLVNNPAGCDNDIIYGMTRQLVEFSDSLIRTLLAGVRAANLSAENLGFLISAVPVVETLPIDEAFELAAKIAEDMEVAYLAASTELLKIEIACELFCLAQNNDCVLTLEMVRDYFQEKANIEFTYTDPVSFFADFVTGTFVSNAVYYGMNILFFQIFAFGGKFLEFLFTDYLRVINSMFNDPNADWVTECDECITTWTHTFDFTVDDGGWIARNIWGTGNCAVYSPATGWSTQDRYNGSTEYSRLIAIERTFTPDTIITNVEFEYDASAFTYGSGLGTMLGLSINTFLDGASQVAYTQLLQACQAGTDILRGNPDDATGDAIRLFLRCSLFSTATYQNTALITSCTVTGEGTNPFE